MDFIHDALEDGRRFRVLTVVDQFSRECPLLAADSSQSGKKVVEYLERVKATRGLPKAITVDNGSEFTSKRWTPGLTAMGYIWTTYGPENP